MNAGNRRFIPGIYNYCDQWCERCPLTRRCRSFAAHRQITSGNPEESAKLKATDAAYWLHIASQVRTALLRAASSTDEGDGEESDAVMEAFFEELFEHYWWNQRDDLQRAVARHPLVRLARRYKDEAEETLSASEGDLKSAAVQLVTEAERPFAGADLEEQAYDIEEQLEVINWYVTLIPAKTERVVGNLLDADLRDGGTANEEDADEEMATMLRDVRLHDAEGSAKVVLIGIDRSMAAWLRLREILPSHETAILNTLRTLKRLRRDLLAAVPGAEHFRRPGFDVEPDENTGETD